MEVTNDANPKFVLKRISRGDQNVIINNQITDSLTISLNTSVVNVPTPIFPVDEEVIPECVTLIADAFSTPNINASHGQSHWQVSIIENDFTNPVAESWEEF